MSRIGKQPIEIPGGVDVVVDGQRVAVSGPRGSLEQTFHSEVKITKDDGTIVVDRFADDGFHRGLHGLTRTLIANMVEGVTKGYEKRLKIEGIGYQAASKNKGVELTVGYANRILLLPPDGVTVTVPDATTIVVKGADKQKVGQFAAQVRAARKPEPYKGKGVRYENEQVRRKEGKSFTSGG